MWLLFEGSPLASSHRVHSLCFCSGLHFFINGIDNISQLIKRLCIIYDERKTGQPSSQRQVEEEELIRVVFLKKDKKDKTSHCPSGVHSILRKTDTEEPLCAVVNVTTGSDQDSVLEQTLL